MEHYGAVPAKMSYFEACDSLRDIPNETTVRCAYVLGLRDPGEATLATWALTYIDPDDVVELDSIDDEDDEFDISFLFDDDDDF